jgi:prephenate dehydrogenase
VSSTDDPPFLRIAIVGVGLIGGSIALAVRDRWPTTRIVGLDRPAVLAHALGSGAIERAAAQMADIGEVDLIILAAPVRQNVELLEQVARHAGASAVITDVGGTKREIVRAAGGLKRSTFVGGHPIGGAERGGFGFARPDLFKDRPWIFTPGETVPSEVLERLFRFARGTGARPATLDAAQHDRLMAFLSHLPQLTASALMDVVGSAAGAEGLRLAGRGLVDTTRLASSPASVWRDICASNADEIGGALDALIARLTELRADLSRGEAVESIFEDAGRRRAELMKGRD